MRLTELVGSSGSSANDREEIRFAKDSPVEGDGFEPVWGFFCQVVVFWFVAGSLFGAGKAVFRSLIAPQVAREFFSLEAISSPWAVDRPAKRIPLWRWGRLVPVANRRAPRASRSALTSDGAARAGGACLPTGASRGGTQPRFLNKLRPAGVMVLSAVCPIRASRNLASGRRAPLCPVRDQRGERVATKNAGLPCLVPAGRAAA